MRIPWIFTETVFCRRETCAKCVAGPCSLLETSPQDVLADNTRHGHRIAQCSNGTEIDYSRTFTAAHLVAKGLIEIEGPSALLLHMCMLMREVWLRF